MTKENLEKHWMKVIDSLDKVAKDDNVSYEEIARRSGLHRSNVSRFFHKKYCPNLKTTIAIAKALGKRLDVEQGE